jgi:Uma2 family endonuclease
MATTEKLLTAEAFEQLPDDGKRYELIDGELREMAPTLNWHGEVEINLGTLLNVHVRPQGLGRVSCGKALYIVRRDPDRLRAADIAFLRQDRVPSLEARQHIMEVIPDLVVEILNGRMFGARDGQGREG